uniref:Fimbrial protein n=1 Tax=Heterorhabditis bacteriophora TaxID=37862 RepID=A0A1I7WRP4_HETBA
MLWAGIAASGSSSLEFETYRVTKLDVQAGLNTQPWDQNNS